MSKWAMVGALSVACLVFLFVKLRRPTMYTMYVMPMAPAHLTLTIRDSREMPVLRLSTTQKIRATATPQPRHTFLLCKVSLRNNTSSPLWVSSFRLTDANGKQLYNVSEPAQEIKPKRFELAPGATQERELVFQAAPGTRPVRIEGVMYGCMEG